MVDTFKDQVKKSFSSCKQDIESLKEMISKQNEVIEKMIEESNQKSQLIESLQSQLNNGFEELKSQIENSNKIKIESESSQIIDNNIVSRPKEIKETKEVKQKDSYEALLEFKAKLNKRDMLKQKLLSIVPKEGIVLSELRFLFVEHFRYCSKATFYNYLKELELSRTIRIEREQTKNLVYLSGELSSHQSIESSLHR